MNKLANQLAIESGFGVEAAEQAFNGQVLNNSLERFYNKIVRECAEVAGCNGHVSGFALGDLIKEHFGVE